jgi:hypothetical protein
VTWSVEDLQTWLKRQQEPKKPQPMGRLRTAFEVIKIELELFMIRQRQLSRLGDEWAARFDPTQRKGHVPFSKGSSTSSLP